MNHIYRATAFIRFSISDERMKEVGLDIEMPPSGVLHDDILELLDGLEGVTKVESVVITQCAPQPTALQEYEVIQSMCEGCKQLKATSETQYGRLCGDCHGSVVPFRRRKEIENGGV